MAQIPFLPSSEVASDSCVGVPREVEEIGMAFVKVVDAEVVLP